MKINNYLDHYTLSAALSYISTHTAAGMHAQAFTISTWLQRRRLVSVFTGCASFSFFFFFIIIGGRNCSFYWWQAIWKCPCWIVTGATLFWISCGKKQLKRCRNRGHTKVYSRMERSFFMWPLADWSFWLHKCFTGAAPEFNHTRGRRRTAASVLGVQFKGTMCSLSPLGGAMEQCFYGIDC